MDAHYRELWIPFERLGAPLRLRRQAQSAETNVAVGGTGFWLVEVDMNLVFHSPFVRTVTFVTEEDLLPVRSFWHMLSGLFRKRHRDDAREYLQSLDRVRLERGRGVLSDLPEAIVSVASRHILSIPWKYWRYPLGAHRRRERRLYEGEGEATGAPKADRGLQIKDMP
jgi:hypothetical protein